MTFLYNVYRSVFGPIPNKKIANFFPGTMSFFPIKKVKKMYIVFFLGCFFFTFFLRPLLLMRNNDDPYQNDAQTLVL